MAVQRISTDKKIKGCCVMNGTALDLKEHIEQKDVYERYAHYDFVYVMLDKRIDHLGDDVKDLRSEMRVEFTAVRDEMRSEFTAVRGEIKDVRGEIKELRDEMRGEFTAVRGEIKEVRDELRGEIKDLRTEVLGEIAKTNQRMDGLFAQTTQRIDALSSQMVSMKTWGISLLITILLVVLAPHIVSLLG